MNITYLNIHLIITELLLGLSTFSDTEYLTVEKLKFLIEVC